MFYLLYKLKVKILIPGIISGLVVVLNIYAQTPLSTPSPVGVNNNSPFYTRPFQTNTLPTKQPLSLLGRLEGDYTTYIVPQEIFAGMQLEIAVPEVSISHIEENVQSVEIKPENLARVLAKAVPMLIETATPEIEKTSKEEMIYDIYLKKLPRARLTLESVSKEEGTPPEGKRGKESQGEIIVSVIFGKGGKATIVIPPLNPEDVDKFIKELVRNFESIGRKEALPPY